jgi:hypothetical protein
LLGQLFSALFSRKRAETPPPAVQPAPRPVIETEEDFRKAMAGLSGGAVAPAPSPMMMDKRAIELLYINRVTAQRIDAMIDMPDSSPDDRVRVMSMAQGGLNADESAWADIPGQSPDKGGVTALTTRRALLMGDDRKDSMTALWAAAGALMHFATDDPSQPIPAVIDLSGWANTTQSLDSFIRHELGELGAYLDTMLRDKRLAFLFDGLDSLSPERKNQVEAFLAANPDVISIVDLTPNR